MLNSAVVAAAARRGRSHVDDGGGILPVDGIAIAEITDLGGLTKFAFGVVLDQVDATGDKGLVEAQILDYGVELAASGRNE